MVGIGGLCRRLHQGVQEKQEGASWQIQSDRAGESRCGGRSVDDVPSRHHGSRDERCARWQCQCHQRVGAKRDGAPEQFGGSGDQQKHEVDQDHHPLREEQRAGLCQAHHLDGSVGRTLGVAAVCPHCGVGGDGGEQCRQPDGRHRRISHRGGVGERRRFGHPRMGVG